MEALFGLNSNTSTTDHRKMAKPGKNHSNNNKKKVTKKPVSYTDDDDEVDNHNNNSNNDGLESDGAAFGLTRLPTGTSIIEATFGPDVVREVDPDDRVNVLDVMDYIAYKIIRHENAQNIEIDVQKRKDEKQPQNIIYQVMMAFPGEGVIITSDHTDYLKRELLSQAVLRVTQPIRWYADFERRRCVIHVTVNSIHNKTALKRVHIRCLELEEYVTIVEHESDEQRVAAKRRRTERT